MQLAAPEAELVRELSRQLGREPDATLHLLLTLPDDPSDITTAIEDGHFTRLSLRALRPWQLGGVGERPLVLELPALSRLRELDVAGLSLGTLRVDHLERLERLDAGHNRLRQLALPPAAPLVALSVPANDLMVLDLRRYPTLQTLEATGNTLTGLLLPEGGALRSVRAARNQLMVLELRRCEALTELVLARNALVRLALDAPALRHLDVGDNQLTELDTHALPALRRLRVTHNRLDTLDLGPLRALRRLDAAHNYLAQLDCRRADTLEQLDVTANQLQRLQLGSCPALTRLACARNHLETLPLGGLPGLRRLDCAANRLRRLDLADAPTLCELSAAGNRLHAIELDGSPALARADLRDNPLTTVRLGSSPVLAGLQLSGSPTIEADEAQRRRLPALCAREDVAQPEDLATLDRWQLHRFAATYDQPDREAVLLRLVRDTDRLALGTAVMIYWMSSPHYYRRFDAREDVPAYALPGWDLLEAIEERVRDGAYTHDDIFFDPRNDQQTVDVTGRDWTRHKPLPGHEPPPGFLALPRGLTPP